MAVKLKSVAKIPNATNNIAPKIRKFVLNRLEDATGTSGEGIVAMGIRFPNGLCVLYWTSVIYSLGHYQSIADVEAIHGHGGKTVVQWVGEL